MTFVWKIAAGVFVGIVAAAIFFGVLSDSSKPQSSDEKWTRCNVIVRAPVLFKKSGVQLIEGQVYQGKVSDKTGEIIVLLGDHELHPPRDTVEIKQ